ncbi:hypothetical protein FQN50_001639 [Emmonsiellopsis sp. PD_5]|nr:hypothetical protein FQN50_001639 [Emmonsiellopsis sp. PD_5]
MPESRYAIAWSSWKLEFSALIGSVLSFVTMSILLVCFNDRPIFDWKGVTLNAIISILAVSMKTTLIFAVAELIGQWKWIAFSQDTRPLMDFERIDLASRGPLGSLSILFRLNERWPVRLGALVIVLAIGLDPFSQQLLQFHQGTEFVEASTSSGGDVFNRRQTMYYQGEIVDNRAQTLSKDPGVPIFTTALDLGMQTAMFTGLSHTREMIDQQVNLQCPTGNCTWPPFQTLGVCHRCSDLSSELNKISDFGTVFGSLYPIYSENMYRKQDGTAFVLPNGHFLVNINGCPVADTRPVCPHRGLSPPSLRMTSFGTGDPNKTNSMQDIDTLIWSMSVIHLDLAKIGNSSRPEYLYKWPDIPIRATECAIYYCVKTIKSKVEGNVIHEEVTEATDAKRDPNSWQLSSDGERDFANLEWNESYFRSRYDLILNFPSNASKSVCKIGETAIWSISQFTRDLLSKNITGGDNTTAAISERLHNGSFNGAFENNRGIPEAVGNIWNPEKLDIPGTFATLATSMTNQIRGSNQEYPSDPPVEGLKGVPTTYYKVKWGWTALPGAVLVGGMLFWYMTVRNSVRRLMVVPAWKNSSLAVISRGSTAAEVLKGANTVKEMDIKARERRVRIPLDDTSPSARTSDEHGGGMFLMQQVNTDEDDTRPSERSGS